MGFYVSIDEISQDSGMTKDSILKFIERNSIKYSKDINDSTNIDKEAFELLRKLKLKMPRYYYSMAYIMDKTGLSRQAFLRLVSDYDISMQSFYPLSLVSRRFHKYHEYIYNYHEIKKIMKSLEQMLSIRDMAHKLSLIKDSVIKQEHASAIRRAKRELIKIMEVLNEQ